MDVSNASLYDGASAVAEASLMAVRANRKSNLTRSRSSRRESGVSPRRRGDCGNQALRFEDVPYSPEAASRPSTL